jgi:hypothetical protein
MVEKVEKQQPTAIMKPLTARLKALETTVENHRKTSYATSQ